MLADVLVGLLLVCMAPKTLSELRNTKRFSGIFSSMSASTKCFVPSVFMRRKSALSRHFVTPAA